MRYLIAFLALGAAACPATADAPDPSSAETQPVSETQPAGAVAEGAEEKKPAARPFDVLHNDRLTGDWWGARTWLEDRGLSINLSVTTSFEINTKGGVQTRHAHSFPGRYDLEFTLDTGAAGLWPGGTLYARAEGGWSESVSARGYVGDLFGVDYNGTFNTNQEILLAELWYEQVFFDEKLRFRIGRMAPGNDFDTNAYANDSTTQFMNTALVNSPNLPGAFYQYPLGMQLVLTPCKWFYAAAGVFDAQIDSIETGFETAFHGDAWTMSLYELGLTPTWKTPWGDLPGHYRVGLWYDPQTKPQYYNDLNGRRRTVPMRSDDLGFYSSFDQMLFRENPSSEGDEQGLGVFARYSYARADVNTIEHAWSCGGQYLGLIPTRDADVLGFGVAQGSLSKGLRYEGGEPNRETVLELYYNCQLLPWLSFTPDMQWILNPGGENGRDAFVIGFRFQAIF